MVPGEPVGLLQGLLTEIRHLTVLDVRAGKVEPTEAVVDASVIVYFHEPDRDAPHPQSLRVRLERPWPDTPWPVALASLVPLLERGQAGMGPAAAVVSGC